MQFVSLESRPLRMRRYLAVAVLPALLVLSPVDRAFAEDTETMLADCKVRAARQFRIPVGAVDVKYEGQRVDGTHAINGTARTVGGEGTFQCSFDRSGRRIVQFTGSIPPGGRPQGQDGGHREVRTAFRAGGGQFDATGNIPCAKGVGSPMGQCAFGVSRAGGGSAAVVVTQADGRRRAIFFRNGRPLGADASPADGAGVFRAARRGDLNLIEVGDERYEIPDAVVSGG
jgi:hypothetical protein